MSNKMTKKFIDIGANLLDGMYQGLYNGKRKHNPDLTNVLNRAWSIGLTHIIVTAGNLQEAKDALKFVECDPRLFSTIGVHPTRCNEFDDEKNDFDYLNQLIQVAKKGAKSGKIVAVGECGLDFERLQFCDKQTQLKHFEKHFKIVEETGLPMFLHNRKSAKELYDILKQNRNRWTKAVIHSFGDSIEDLKLLLSLGEGIFIGINGCSLKTEENLNMIKEIPSKQLLIETDCPWCGIKKSHASYKYVKTEFPQVANKKHSMDKCVKGRSEPCHIIQVLEVIAAVKNENIDELCEIVYNNTMDLFFSKNSIGDSNTCFNKNKGDSELNEWREWLIKQQNL
eukprot:160784_1